MKLSMCEQGPSGEVADLFVVMQRAYSEDPQSKYICTICTSPDAAVVRAEDYQIKDIERFCTSSIEFGILMVDKDSALPALNLKSSWSIQHFPLGSSM